ncbi:Uncharacterised protein [Vibrio cholerae]|uniref:Uncharacterized protein n=1 Tax=Vibrio cholerae TaxID=666 RepID=A0A655UQA1_VIBCL|nr:Uncharacterised protein [Vibrio cholerae]
MQPRSHQCDLTRHPLNVNAEWRNRADEWPQKSYSLMRSLAGCSERVRAYRGETSG